MLIKPTLVFGLLFKEQAAAMGHLKEEPIAM